MKGYTENESKLLRKAIHRITLTFLSHPHGVVLFLGHFLKDILCKVVSLSLLFHFQFAVRNSPSYIPEEIQGGQLLTAGLNISLPGASSFAPESILCQLGQTSFLLPFHQGKPCQRPQGSASEVMMKQETSSRPSLFS